MGFKGSIFLRTKTKTTKNPTFDSPELGGRGGVGIEGFTRSILRPSRLLYLRGGNIFDEGMQWEENLEGAGGFSSSHGLVVRSKKGRRKGRRKEERKEGGGGRKNLLWEVSFLILRKRSKTSVTLLNFDKRECVCEVKQKFC